MIEELPQTEFSPFQAVSDFLVGPHCRLQRNGLVFNDRSKIECYWVEEFGGFESPDLRVGEDDNVQMDGGIPQPGFYGGRTMTMTGWVQAGTYPHLVRMQRALLDSMVGLVETPMLITTAGGELGLPDFGMFLQPDVLIDCRPVDKPQLSVKIEQEDRTGVFKRNFTIALRAITNPTYRGTAIHSETLLPTIQSELGRIYDRTYDLVYATPLSAGVPTVAGENVLSVVNKGNYDAPPILRFKGPMAGVTLTNQTTQQYIHLTGSIDGGKYVEINVKTGSITDQDGELAANVWDPASDWLVLHGTRDKVTGQAHTGINELKLVVQSFGAGAGVDVTWQDTWI